MNIVFTSFSDVCCYDHMCAWVRRKFEAATDFWSNVCIYTLLSYHVYFISSHCCFMLLLYRFLEVGLGAEVFQMKRVRIQGK